MAKPTRAAQQTQHEIYEAVAQETRAEGFHVTLEDVVRAHEKMEDGREPGDIVGQHLVAALRRRLPARPVAPASPHQSRRPEGGERGASEPASLPLRLPPDVQAALAQAAAAQNQTLEQAIIAALRRVYGPAEAAPPVVSPTQALFALWADQGKPAEEAA